MIQYSLAYARNGNVTRRSGALFSTVRLLRFCSTVFRMLSFEPFRFKYWTSRSQGRWMVGLRLTPRAVLAIACGSTIDSARIDYCGLCVRKVSLEPLLDPYSSYGDRSAEKCSKFPRLQTFENSISNSVIRYRLEGNGLTFGAEPTQCQGFRDSDK